MWDEWPQIYEMPRDLDNSERIFAKQEVNVLLASACVTLMSNGYCDLADELEDFLAERKLLPPAHVMIGSIDDSPRRYMSRYFEEDGLRSPSIVPHQHWPPEQGECRLPYGDPERPLKVAQHFIGRAQARFAMMYCVNAARWLRYFGARLGQPRGAVWAPLLCTRALYESIFDPRWRRERDPHLWRRGHPRPTDVIRYRPDGPQ